MSISPMIMSTHLLTMATHLLIVSTFLLIVATHHIDCVNMLGDWANTTTNQVNTPNISSSNLWILNPSLLQLLLMDLIFICKLKINIVFTTGSWIYFSSVIFVSHNLHHPPVYHNFLLELHLHFVPNIFLNFIFHVLIRFELIDFDRHRVSFKFFNGHQ
jgi:hypothetical protein